LEKAESVFVVGLENELLLLSDVRLPVVPPRDFEELELVVEFFDELEEVSPVLACAMVLIAKKVINMMTTHKLVSFFITFSFLSVSF
jgi:hypothetical protein